MDYICETCGKKFSRRSNSSKPSPRYCSKACQYAGQRGKPGTAYACQHCGTIFVRTVYPSHPVPRYCSRACTHAARRGKPGTSQDYRRNGRDVPCETCRKQFYIPKGRIEKHKHHFCSKECRVVWEKTRTPEITVVCDRCGATFSRKPWLHQTDGSRRRFCGAECRNEYIKEHPEIASHSGGKVTRACAVCGKPVTKCRSLIERRNGNVFCSRACLSAYQSEHMSGENCNFWQGGFDRTERTDWECNGGMKWKRDCKKRDAYTCQVCGKQLSKLSRGLHVHHKAGFTKYPDLRSELLNGTCLCERCHDWVHSGDGQGQREAWEAEALAALEHLLPAQPTLALEAAE